jgi:hypothetical protein
MMPENAKKKIRSVVIYYNSIGVCGFSFFDEELKKIWQVGYAC